jgi:hypothetical protein
MEFMSCGKPAVAPRTTAMIDYLSTANAFLIESTDELTAWPHDPRKAFRTLRYVTNWTSLCEAYRASYDVAKKQPQRYADMSAQAVDSLQAFCSQAVAEQRLQGFLTQLFEHRAPALEAPQA